MQYPKTHLYLLSGVFAGLWTNLMVEYYKFKYNTNNTNNVVDDEYIRNFGGIVK